MCFETDDTIKARLLRKSIWALLLFGFSTQIPAMADEPSMPIRISTHFLKSSNLTGSYTVQSPQSKVPALNFSISGPIQWSESPSNEPAPGPGAIADFRDSLGCATYTETNAALCFQIMGDVMSVGVNSREMKSQVAARDGEGSCSYEIKNTQFIKATGNNTSVTVLFSGNAVPQGDCPSTGEQPVQIQFELRAGSPAG